MSESPLYPGQDCVSHGVPSSSIAQFERFSALYDQHIAHLNNQRMTAANRLKSLCPKLNELGITHVWWDYDGQGDSGGIEDVRYAFQLIDGPVLSRKAFEDTINGPEFADVYPMAENEQRTNWKGEPITRCDRIEEDIFALLPGGFEINEGSYGTVHLDVQAGTLTLEHSERIVDVHYSETEL